MSFRSIAVSSGLIALLGAGGCPSDDADSDGQTSSAGSTATSSTASGSGEVGSTVGSDGSTVTSTSTSAGSGSGGEPPPSPCVEDSDCSLDSDCCHCRAYAGELPDDHTCDSPPCFAPMCDGIGVSVARCVESVCTPVIACDPSRVTCDGLPPECAEGQAPTVGPDECWSGRCVAEEMCTPEQ